jgi:hypothetical protein
MSETLVAIGYVVFVLGVVLLFIHPRTGVKLVILGLVVIAKTLLAATAITWVRQRSAGGPGDEVLWTVMAILVAAIAGAVFGALFVVWLALRGVCRLLADRRARAALGGAVIGTIAAEMLRGRDEHRRLR